MIQKLLLSKEDQEKIAQAIGTAEAKTNGEILPVLVQESDRYPGARWRFAFGFAVSLSFVEILLNLVPLAPLYHLMLFILFLALGHALVRIAFFKQRALSQKEVDEECFQRALEMFHQHKVGHTRDRTGILIFVSLLEHRVIVLADRSINEKMSQDTWKEIVDPFLQKIRQGQLVEGYIKAIETCGNILSEHFPKTPSNADELPNQIILA